MLHRYCIHIQGCAAEKFERHGREERVFALVCIRKRLVPSARFVRIDRLFGESAYSVAVVVPKQDALV